MSCSSPSPSSPPPPLYRLIYFDSRGAAELTRYILAVAKVPYDDLRYPLHATASGFGVVSKYSDFLQHQQLGHFDVNMGQLPILQVLTADGTAAVATLGQSHAVNRFLAERHLLFGDTSIIQRAQIDAFYEAIRDLRSAYLQSKKNGSRKEWLQNTLPLQCEKLERSLPTPTYQKHNNDNHLPQQQQQQWLIGTSPSLADIALYSLLGPPTISVVTGCAVSGLDGFNATKSDATKNCPRLTASVQAVATIRGVQEWEQRRPDTFT